MTRIQPFRGWRYDLAAAGAASLDELLTPPYDVISPAQQAEFYQRHPHNIIRLDLTRDEPGDNDHVNRYTRAAATLSDWQHRGVLRQEAAPAIYLLRQRYTLPDGRQAVRSGLIFRLLATPWGEGILPHERTFPTAKADRLALKIATRSQCSPIFLLYSDPTGEAQAPALAFATQPPHAVLLDDDGVEHALWAVTDPRAISAITQALEPHTFYLADGHHRYETALNYRRWRRSGELPAMPPPKPLTQWEALPGYLLRSSPASASLQAYDYAWVYATAIEDPGLAILPSHRCLHDLEGFAPAALLAGLRRHFDLTPVGDDDALLAVLGEGQPDEHRCALILPGSEPGYLVRLRHTAETSAALLAVHHPTVAAVDVAVLQTLVLGGLLGISPEPDEQKRHVAFTPDTPSAIARTREGVYQAAFLVNPTPLAQLKAVSEAGEVMPPKATYFYPKLPSGLVINVIDG